MTDIFSIREALRFGWEKTRNNSGLLFSIIISVFALQVVSSVVADELGKTWEGFFVGFLFGAVGVVLGVGFTRVVLKIAKSERAGYKDIIPPFKLLWEYVVVSFLAGLIIFGGLLLLIVPGIYFILRYAFVRFAVLEGAGITGSLRQSAKMTLGVKWDLLGFFLIMIGINILGALAFMVGLLITIPVTFIAYARLYHLLKKNVEDKA